jgi:TrfA protein
MTDPNPKLRSIREFLADAAPAAIRHMRELCEKHGVDLDSPWPPRFPKETEPQQPQPPAKIVQLDFWDDGKRAAPNAVFRSALFPALNNKQQRRYYPEQERICSVDGVDVLFMGTQFDQSDLDVYLELLNLARPLPLGTPIRFSAYALLKALGWPTGGKYHERLHTILIRLCGGVVDMTDHKKRYFGQLIQGGIRDEITKHYEIAINPKFAVLFGFGMWAAIDREQRRALGRNQTAKALHAYYSSHAAPGPHSFDTLAKIAGLTNSNPRQRRADLIKAHDHMKAKGCLGGYEVKGDTIAAHVRHTPGQIRHLAKRKPKPRRKP